MGNLEKHLRVGAQVDYVACVADCEKIMDKNRVNEEVALPARFAL